MFNYGHLFLRNVVKLSFSALNARWRMLQMMQDYHMPTQSKILSTIIALYKFIRMSLTRVQQIWSKIWITCPTWKMIGKRFDTELISWPKLTIALIRTLRWIIILIDIYYYALVYKIVVDNLRSINKY